MKIKGTNMGDKFFKTGFFELDERIRGFKRGEITLVGGRPSMGKSVFAMNLLMTVCFEEKQSAYVYSLDKSRNQYEKMLIDVYPDIVSIDDWDKKLIIDDTDCGTESYHHFCETVRQLRKTKDITFVVVDYLQIMGTRFKVDSRKEEILGIMRGVKELAIELDIHIVVLSQLSRAPEKRIDHRPIISDLREKACRSIPDVILMLYRERYYSDDKYERPFDKELYAEVVIAKYPSLSLLPYTIKLEFDPHNLMGGFRNPKENSHRDNQ